MDFENILSAVQPFVIMFAALLGAFMTAMWIAVVIWTFRDIRSRSRDIFAQILATLMVLIFFPLFPLPGLVLYLILRPRETLSEIYERSLEEEALLQGIEERLACPGCNRRIEEDFMICPTCHTRLKKACPACGRLLHLRWNICAYCGAVQTAVKPAPSSTEPVSLAIESATSPLKLSEISPSPTAVPEAHHEDRARSEPPLGSETQAWAASQGPLGAEERAAEEYTGEQGAEAGVEPESQQAAETAAEPGVDAGLYSYGEAEPEEAPEEPISEPDPEEEAETLPHVSE
jgi:RNA polymerase subunit RPABC4/transcription elongation factor Spt4